MPNFDFLDALIVILGTARLTRLVTTDAIADKARVWVLDTALDRGGIERARWWEDLMACPYCIGFWLSVAAVAAVAAFPTLAVWLLAPWALSYTVGALEAYVFD